MNNTTPTQDTIRLDTSKLLGKTLQHTSMSGLKPEPPNIRLDASKLLGKTLKGTTMTGIKPVGLKPDNDPA